MARASLEIPGLHTTLLAIKHILISKKEKKLERISLFHPSISKTLQLSLIVLALLIPI